MRQHSLHVLARRGHLVLAALVDLSRGDKNQCRVLASVFQFPPESSRVFQLEVHHRNSGALFQVRDAVRAILEHLPMQTHLQLGGPADL